MDHVVATVAVKTIVWRPTAAVLIRSTSLIILRVLFVKPKWSRREVGIKIVFVQRVRQRYKVISSQTDVPLVIKTVVVNRNVLVSTEQRWMTIYGYQILQPVNYFRITTAYSVMLSLTGKPGTSERNVMMSMTPTLKISQQHFSQMGAILFTKCQGNTLQRQKNTIFYTPDISVCNQTGLWKTYSEDVEEACRRNTAPYF